ncbi:type 1 glutamine amidotransferase family protein [Otoolea muris]|uniref:type 1 glutamine amidotransferase family protein n=1 Tax=Otoolea muris TaxID=2941515 RepID=UPI00203A628A|nr:type 1 glutamine amidotransferase family protein [Otoolea muris]
MDMKMKMEHVKKEVLVFVFDGYADWEPAWACAELNAPDTGYTVRTIGLDKSAKVSMGGFRVLPDYSVKDYPREFRLLILPGGNAWTEQKNDAVLPVVDDAVRRGMPVAAICNAVNFMAEHGFLDEIRHSGNSLAFLKSQAPHYRGEAHFIEEQAVCDANIVTANGTGALEFAKQILLLLHTKPEQEILKWYELNRLGFYR